MTTAIDTTNQEKRCCSIPLHPASQIFPMMGESELRELANDIRANGLMEPIVIYDGQVLDGRNRLKACEIAGVEPTAHEVTGIVSPVVYVVSKNLHRRHLTVGQRATIAEAMMPLLKDEARKRQAHGLTAPGRSLPMNSTEAINKGAVRDIAARAIGVSPFSVQQAIDVKKADPELYERVKRGEISVNAAATGHRVPPLRGGQQPKTIDTKRGEQIAAANKRRMGDGLAMIGGACEGLQHIDLQMALAVCTKEEIDVWATKAETHARELRQFAAKLRGAMANGKSA